MSRLDRQLDRVHNEERHCVVWPSDEEVDFDQVRSDLLKAVDDHDRRVPLDLRQVNGAPRRLIDLLIEARAYARSQDKILSISYALPPMQEALNPKRRGKKQRSKEDDAGQVAQSLLDAERKRDQPATYDPSKAEKIVRPKKKKKKKNTSPLMRYAILAAIVLAGTLVLVAIEYFWIFGQETQDFIVPQKTFEE